MKKRITNAKIACLDINLQKTRMNLGVHITIDDPEQLEQIRNRCGFFLAKASSPSVVRSNVLVTANPKSHSSAYARFLDLGPMSF
jgi:chaperonin GroEL (HSP60 family)